MNSKQCNCGNTYMNDKIIKCDDCITFCTMCDVRIPRHKGRYKCPTCECRYCEIHIKDIVIYGECPSCWMNLKEECMICGLRKIDKLTS